MIISIDCRWIDSSGIGVYLRESLPFFFNSSHSFILFGNRKKILEIASKRKNIEIIDCHVKPFSVTELFFFPKKILKKINSSDLYYSPYFNIPGNIKIPVYTTIHDIIFPDMPELTSWIGLKARMWFYNRAFTHSKSIFTVSEFSKSRIEHYSKGKINVVVTHSAIQPHLLQRNNSFPIKRNIILFIGNIKKHKGLSVLLKAFYNARKEGLEYDLVIAGNRENLRSCDTDISDSDRDCVQYTGFLPDEKLKELLAEASLLVQPSLYEGFCLPPLEAMVSGTSVLISDIPVLREIYSEYPKKILGQEFPVNWFRAGDSNDLKNKLLELLHNKKPMEIRFAPEFKKIYTFEKTASTILKYLEKN